MYSIEDVVRQRKNIEDRLVKALHTMERKDTIFALRSELVKLQNECPHKSDDPNFAWATEDGTCPFCGFHFA